MIATTSVAAANVGHTPVISADGHVTAAGIAVPSIPTTMSIAPIVSVPITADASRTAAELAARKHNRLIGRTHGIRKRRQGHETGREHQN